MLAIPLRLETAICYSGGTPFKIGSGFHGEDALEDRVVDGDQAGAMRPSRMIGIAQQTLTMLGGVSL